MALSHAGLLEEEVTSLLVEKDWDDGRLEYDVDFWQEMVEYEFTIDGVTGVVLKHKREDHADAAASFGDIGKAAAKNAALDHEGLTESQVSGLWAEVDWDNGRLIYDVVFWAGMVEYEYEIDGATGAVLKHEQESHLEGGSAAGDIGGRSQGRRPSPRWPDGKPSHRHMGRAGLGRWIPGIRCGLLAGGGGV